MAYPETEKILQLCKLYHVTADDLLLDSGQTQEPPKKSRLWLLCGALVCCLVFLLLLFALQGKKSKEQYETMKAIMNDWQSQYHTVQKKNIVLEQKLTEISGENMEASEADLDAKEYFEQLRCYFFDFARNWRLDYVPCFEADHQPRESADYLMWAFAINLDGWEPEEKGTMSRDYVQNQILMHFAIPDISHTPLPKTWNFDGEQYTAVPGGIKDDPIYVLESFALQDDIFTVELAQCGIWKDGSFCVPMTEDLEKLEAGISEAYGSWLRPMSRERFSFTLGHNGPVFLSHTRMEEYPKE